MMRDLLRYQFLQSISTEHFLILNWSYITVMLITYNYFTT